jgi:hypothetical protein
MKKCRNACLLGGRESLKTIRFVVGFFPDARYNLLLETHVNYRNVWLHEDGRITICLYEDDINYLKELPRLYHDINSNNKEYLFMNEKERIFKNRNEREV